MDRTSSTSSAWLLVSLAIAAILPVVWSAPTSLKNPFTSQTKEGIRNVTKVLIEKTNELYVEICKTPNLCGSSVEHFLRIDLELPEINDVESRCLSTKFDKEKCLPKIYTDLLRFQTPLKLLEKYMPSNKNIIEFIQFMSKSLANDVRKLEENPSEVKEDSTTDITLDDSSSEDPWTRDLKSYIILKSFKDYMEKTARAIRAVIN